MMSSRSKSVALGLRAASAVAAGALVAATLAGCGQKGPLTLPKPLPAASGASAGAR